MRYKRSKVILKLICLAYFLVIVALAVFLKENHILIALLFLFNVVVVFYIGIAIIRSLIFPFSLWIIKDGVSS